MRILITINSYQDLDGSWNDIFQKQNWKVDLVRGPLSESDLLNTPPIYDGIICGEDILNQKTINHLLPQLKVISKSGVGLDTIDQQYAKEKHISVLCTHGINTQSVVEHFIGLTLALLRNFNQHFNEISKGQWTRTFSHDLYGKTLGIIGLGAVGRRLAEVMQVLGVRTIGYDPYSPSIPKSIQTCNSIESLLKESDIIGLTCALTKETENLINSQTLTLIKKGAILINTSRGRLVNSSHIAAALKEGVLAGYATDTLDTEPPQKEHPLLSTPNTIITPHIASKTYETSTQQVTAAVENLIQSLCIPAQ